MNPESLLVYYGFPGQINGAEELEQARPHFEPYRWVVLGDGLDRRVHPQHVLTSDLIKSLPQVGFFGYVDLGVYTPHGKVQNLSLDEIRERAKAWRDLGVKGILLDDFGYDFGNTRERQNDAVAILHDLGLGCVANSWDPRHALDSDPGPANLKGRPSRLGKGDFYMWESYLWKEGQFCSYKTWRSKANTLAPLLKGKGVGVWALTTAGAEDSYVDLTWEFVAQCAWLEGWAGVGWGEPNFSAHNNLAPKRTLPEFYGRGKGGLLVLGESSLARESTLGEVSIHFAEKSVQLGPSRPFWKRWFRR